MAWFFALIYLLFVSFCLSNSIIRSKLALHKLLSMWKMCHNLLMKAQLLLLPVLLFSAFMVVIPSDDVYAVQFEIIDNFSVSVGLTPTPDIKTGGKFGLNDTPTLIIALTLPDGSAAPSWLTVDNDHLHLTVSPPSDLTVDRSQIFVINITVSDGTQTIEDTMTVNNPNAPASTPTLGFTSATYDPVLTQLSIVFSENVSDTVNFNFISLGGLPGQLLSDSAFTVNSNTVIIKLGPAATRYIIGVINTPGLGPLVLNIEA